MLRAGTVEALDTSRLRMSRPRLASRSRPARTLSAPTRRIDVLAALRQPTLRHTHVRTRLAVHRRSTRGMRRRRRRRSSLRDQPRHVRDVQQSALVALMQLARARWHSRNGFRLSSSQFMRDDAIYARRRRTRRMEHLSQRRRAAVTSRSFGTDARSDAP